MSKRPAVLLALAVVASSCAWSGSSSGANGGTSTTAAPVGVRHRCRADRTVVDDGAGRIDQVSL